MVEVVFPTLANGLSVAHAGRGAAILGIVAASIWGWTPVVVGVAAVALFVEAVEAIATARHARRIAAPRAGFAGAHA